VKDRAARLRVAGERAYRRHLDALAGSEQRVLVEREGLGRTEGFTLVGLDQGAPGEIATVRIAGNDGAKLVAAPRRAAAA